MIVESTEKVLKLYLFVTLNAMKNLNIHSSHLQILRKAQNDNTKR